MCRDLRKVWESGETIQELFCRPEVNKSLVRTRRRREAGKSGSSLYCADVHGLDSYDLFY